MIEGKINRQNNVRNVYDNQFNPLINSMTNYVLGKDLSDSTDNQDIDPSIGNIILDVCGNSQNQDTFTSPDKWWHRAYKSLRKLDKSTKINDDIFSREVREYIDNCVPDLIDILKQELTIPKSNLNNEDETQQIKRAPHVIFEMSRSLIPILEVQREAEIKFVPMEQLLNSSERFSLEISNNDESIYSIFKIKSKNGNIHNFPISHNNNVIHKGGAPRAILKVLSGAPSITTEAELPPSDFDIIISGNEKEVEKEASIIGVSPADIDIVSEIDFQHLVRTRDMDMNECFLNSDGLIFSSDALSSAKSGKIALQETLDRGLFGSENYIKNGVTFAKNRGIMRLIKMVAEEKALSFDFLPLNKQNEMGIYWLVLARKFSSKTNSEELLQKAFYLGKLIGQVNQEDETIYDVLNREHAKYYDFDFDEDSLGQEDQAKWLLGKFSSQVRRNFRHVYQVPSNIILDREQDDLIPFSVSLENFNFDNSKVNGGWEEFLENCRKRKKLFNEEHTIYAA